MATPNGMPGAMPCARPHCPNIATRWRVDKRFDVSTEGEDAGAWICEPCTWIPLPDSIFVINPHFAADVLRWSVDRDVFDAVAGDWDDE